MTADLLHFAQKVQNSNSELLYLVRGKSGELDIWQYILVDKMKLPLFQMVLKKKETLNPHKYGKVIKYGYGKNPPQEVAVEIEEQFAA